MTFEELEHSLPNGLHDAELHKYVVDYEKRLVTIDIAVWIGDMDQPRKQRETYREARIHISGLQFIISEAPDPRYPFGDSKSLTIDTCDMRDKLNQELLNTLARDAFVRTIWVNQWNAFMHIAAKEAVLEWLADARVRS